MKREDDDLVRPVPEDRISERRVLEWATAHADVPISDSVGWERKLRNPEVSMIEDEPAIRRTFQIWESREEAFRYAARPNIKPLVLLEDRHWHPVRSLHIRETVRRLADHLNKHGQTDDEFGDAIRAAYAEEYYDSDLSSMASTSSSVSGPVVLVSNTRIGICEKDRDGEMWHGTHFAPATFFAGLVGTSEDDHMKAATSIFPYAYELGDDELIEQICAKLPGHKPSEEEARAAVQAFKDLAPPDVDPDENPPPKVILVNDNAALLTGQPNAVIVPGEFAGVTF